MVRNKVFCNNIKTKPIANSIAENTRKKKVNVNIFRLL